MGRDVFRIDRDRPSVGLHRLSQEIETGRAPKRLLPGTGIGRGSKGVDHLIVKTEIEPTLRNPGGQYRFEAGDRFIQITVSLVDLP